MTLKGVMLHVSSTELTNSVFKQLPVNSALSTNLASELFRSPQPVSGTNYGAMSRLHCPLHDFAASRLKDHLSNRSFPDFQ